MKRFTIYCGLNDKDRKQQLISTDEAIEIVTNKVVNAFGFGTINKNTGVYTHEDGTIVNEETIGVILLGAELVSVVAFVNNLKVTFNQELIAVTVEDVDIQLW